MTWKECVVFRIFHQYHPRQIALHVKSLYQGKLHIAGVGDFDFANGKLVPPPIKDLQAFAVINEVNAEIKQLVETAFK